jgi:hypothetical protein
MSGQRHRHQSCAGVDEVFHHVEQSEATTDKGRAHPYEEPAYEVYKMEDM